jgi:hypothetical protein
MARRVVLMAEMPLKPWTIGVVVLSLMITAAIAAVMFM